MVDDVLNQIEQKLTQLEDKEELKDYLLIECRKLEPEQREDVKRKLLSMDHLDKTWIDSIIKQISKAPSEYMIIEEMIKKYKIMFVEGLGIYIYNGKVWEKKSDNYMLKMIGKQMGKWKIGSRVSSVLKQLKADCYEEIQFNLLPVFNFQNCTLELPTGRTHEHSANDLCSIMMEYDYNPQATYSDWHQFVMDICDDNEERYERLQMMCGYVLMNDCHLQKSFMLYGEGANGKSVFLNIIEQVFNKNNVSYLQLDGLGDKFQLIQLTDTLLNISTETKASTNGGEANFKKVVVGETVSACYKNKDFYKFKPRAKLIFALNEIPYSKEINYGFIRRLSYVKFVNQYVDEPKGEHQKKVNRNLEKRLTKNLSGIFNWCYEGYKKLCVLDRFPDIQDDREMKDLFYDISSPIYSFFKDMKPLNERTLTRDIYSIYITWCKDNYITPQSIANFSKQFLTVSSGVYKYFDTTKNIELEDGKIQKVHLRGYEPI